MRDGNDRIKVAIIENSIPYRHLLKLGLELDPGIEVIGLGTTSDEARDLLARIRPDVVVCEIYVLRRDGISFMRNKLLPIVVVSTPSETVVDAILAGAVDFAAKPKLESFLEVETFLKTLIAKVKAAACVKMTKPNFSPYRTEGGLPKLNQVNDKIIAIGASMGGTEDVLRLLQELPPDMPGIVIALDIPAELISLLAERLNAICSMRVGEGRSGSIVAQGQAWLVPVEYRTGVVRSHGGYRLDCAERDRNQGFAPSVDTLFESVALAAGNRAIGILLAGPGHDCAEGLLAMRRRGAATLRQDERSSVVYGMPMAANEIGAVERQAGPEDLPQVLLSLL